MAEPSLLQTAVLALIQGLTEFLPISSSGHLLLPTLLLGWPDQGLAFDIAVHAGTLAAVIAYFRADLIRMTKAGFDSIRGRGRFQANGGTRSVARGAEFGGADDRLLWLLALATVPAGLAGLLLRDWIEEYTRAIGVIAATSIVFGLWLGYADLRGRRSRGLGEMDWRSALLIGLAQMLALIPGASRSGVTMTAALLCRFDRESAARFAFLLAIPVMLASTGLELSTLIAAPPPPRQWLPLVFGASLAGIIAWLSIHWFLRWIGRISFQPFAVYRVALGLLLLWFFY